MSSRTVATSPSSTTTPYQRTSPSPSPSPSLPPSPSFSDTAKYAHPPRTKRATARAIPRRVTVAPLILGSGIKSASINSSIGTPSKYLPNSSALIPVTPTGPTNPIATSTATPHLAATPASSPPGIFTMNGFRASSINTESTSSTTA